jgi:hypothetical protein
VHAMYILMRLLSRESNTVYFLGSYLGVLTVQIYITDSALWKKNLAGVQAAYWGMLEEGRINQATANVLMRSVDEAIDLVSTEPLCDWKGLRSSVQFPSYYRFLQMSRLPRKLITNFTVERLESGCYICAAFLRAHRIARRQLHDFLGKALCNLSTHTDFVLLILVSTHLQ